MKRISLLLAAALLLPAQSWAQGDPDMVDDEGPPKQDKPPEGPPDRVSLGLEPGVLVPMSKFADEVGVGFALRVRGAYELGLGLAIGASVEWAPLSYEAETDSGTGPVTTRETSAYLLMIDLGVRYLIDLKMPVIPFVELAFGLPQLIGEEETRIAGGPSETRKLSESGLGVRVGGGAYYQATHNIRVGLVADFSLASTSRENTQSTREVHHLRVAVPAEYVF
jgi:hypothetical protein